MSCPTSSLSGVESNTSFRAKFHDVFEDRREVLAESDVAELRNADFSNSMDHENMVDSA